MTASSRPPVRPRPALRLRSDWEQEERERLAPWAVRSRSVAAWANVPSGPRNSTTGAGGGIRPASAPSARAGGGVAQHRRPLGRVRLAPDRRRRLP